LKKLAAGKVLFPELNGRDPAPQACFNRRAESTARRLFPVGNQVEGKIHRRFS
jgi:hypothetical protein